MAVTIRNMVGFWIEEAGVYGFPSASTVSDGSGVGKCNFDIQHLEAIASLPFTDMGSDTLGWLHGEIKVSDFGTPPDESSIVYCENSSSVNKGPQLHVKLSGSGFVVGLYQSNGSTLIAWGSTEWTFDTWYEFRVEGGAFGAVLDFGVKGSIANEVTDASYTQLLDVRIHINTTDHNEGQIYCRYRNLALASSTTRADRMAEPNIQEKLHNDSGTPDFDGYNLSSGSNKSDLVDDWEVSLADDGTYLISDIDAGDTLRQTLLTDTLTLDDVIAVKIYSKMRLDLEDKDGVYGSMISDGSGNLQEERKSAIADNYQYRRAIFNTNGNGDPWTQARLDAMEYGFSYTDGGDITNVRGTAVHCEVLAMVADAGTDPAAAQAGPLVNNEPLRSKLQGLVA